MADIDRTLGAHGAQIEELTRRVGQLEAKVDEMLSIMHEAKGGWKTLALVGGVAMTLGAFFYKVGTLLFGHWMK